MAALGVRSPTVSPRVSEHIDAIVDFISTLLQKRHAYVTATGVYMDVSSLRATPAEYGKLAPPGRPVDEALQPHDDKRDARDFALWKSVARGVQPSDEQLVWASPWGTGRPGWHIECSAMSALHAGAVIDIAAGGIDLAFPHHCNTIAQCEAALGSSPWAAMHVHTGHVYIAGRKMSKSLKNFIPVAEVLARRDGAACFRVFCLQYAYRSNVTYSEERLVEAHAHVVKLRECVHVVTAAMHGGGETTTRWSSEHMRVYMHTLEARQRMKAALCNDFDTPSAFATLLSMCTAAAAAAQAPHVPVTCAAAMHSFMSEGLQLMTLGDLQQSVQSTSDQAATQELLVTLRDTARANAVTIMRACKARSTDAERSSADAASSILKECDRVRAALTEAARRCEMRQHQGSGADGRAVLRQSIEKLQMASNVQS